MYGMSADDVFLDSFFSVDTDGKRKTPRCIASVKNEKQNYKWILMEGESPGCYLISIISNLKTSKRVTKIRISGPPLSGSEEVYRVSNWDLVEMRKQMTSHVYTGARILWKELSYPLQEVFSEAFEYACTHWFFTGR